MIHDVDETLTRLLATELAATPGCPVRDRGQITLDPPTVAEANQDGEACVNLYLFDVRENVQERDEGMVRRLGKTVDAPVGVSRPPVRMDLSYLVSAHAGEDPRTEHRLLSDVLTVLLRRKTVATDHLAGSLEGLANAVSVSIAQPEHVTAADPKGLWQALGGTMRPTLALVVTAPLDPFETVWTKRVREAVVAPRPGSGPGERLGGMEALGSRLSVAGIALDQKSALPLADVAVTVTGETATATTGADGVFVLADLSPGPYTLHFHRRAYRPHDQAVSVSPPGRTPPAPLVIALHPLTDAERAAESAATW